jgi:hypothetical protein
MIFWNVVLHHQAIASLETSETNGWGCHISITKREDISHVMTIKKEVIPSEKEVKKREVTILLYRNPSHPFSANIS